jgi:hypothetical protein
MKLLGVLSLVAVLLVLGGIGYAAWRYVTERDTHFCGACTRPIHSHSKTVAVVDGKRGFYCCPACALTQHQQSQVPVDVIELADYLGGWRLAPNQSYVVRNSDVNACLHDQPAVNPYKQPMHSQFDRCAPSILAFRDQRAAVAFSAAHGGRVMKFSDLASDYRR